MTDSTKAQSTPLAAFDSTGTIRIGRDPDNDVVLQDFWVSGHHAELRKSASGCEIVDLNSTNGLHVNGWRVTRSALKTGDRFSIGRHEFLFGGTQLFGHDDQGPTSLVADDITVEVGKAILLDDVSFALRERTLLGIVGPSGCGKSTLLNAMTGIRPATRGRLLYNGMDIRTHYSELRHRIGLVPQDDVLHRQLTVRRALRFAASLRFANDVPRKERKQRVDEVIELLGLSARAKQRVDTLSGGQRKRTSVALELLTEPALLALDEPTSGLDPALDKEVMRELRLQADRGRTVVVVTHSVLHLDTCDRVLVMCLGGRMGYFGPPNELLEFFGSEDWADVFDKVTNEPDHWGQLFRNSDVYRRYVGEIALELVGNAAAQASDRTPTPRAIPAQRTAADEVEAEVTVRLPDVAVEPAAAEVPAAEVPAAEPSAAEAPAVDPPAEPQKKKRSRFADAKADTEPSPAGVQELSAARKALHPVAWLRQVFTLCLRMVAVMVADRGYALFLLALPLVLALLSHTIPGDKGLSPDPEGFSLEAQRLLIVLVVGAAFMGVAIAIREIVNESSIYKRERAVGLSPWAYLISKLIIFVVIDVIQVTLFVYLALLGRGGPKEALVLGSAQAEVTLAVAMVAIASTAIGLLASALARTPEQTTPIMVVSVMAQLVLSGGLFEIGGQKVLEIISVVDPSRWGFAAAAATTDLQNFPFKEDIWEHTTVNWWQAIGVLVLQTIVLVAATRVALRRFEPGRR